MMQHLQAPQSENPVGLRNRTIIMVMMSVFSLLGKSSFAQVPTWLGTQVGNGTYTTTTLTDLGAFRQARIQATSSGAANTRNWEFTIGAGSPDYTTNWRPYSGACNGNANVAIPNYNQVVAPAVGFPAPYGSATLNTGAGGCSGVLPAVTSGNYYTFNITEVNNANQHMSVLETAFNPSGFGTITRSPANVSPCDAVTVTVNLQSAAAAGENVFVRYSTDNYVTSTLVQTTIATGQTSGTAVIPAMVLGTTVSYYAYSSNRTLAQINADVTTYGQRGHDLNTLNMGNNGGANYSYTVAADVQPPVITCAANVNINTTAGLCTGATTLTAPTATDNCNQLGNALDFDGTDDQVTTTFNIPFNSANMTLEAWVKPVLRGDGGNINQFPNNIFSDDPNGNYGRGFGVTVLAASAGFTIEYKSSFRYVSYPFVSNTWYHVAVVYTATNITTYVNGVVADNFNVANATPNDAGRVLRIGKHNDDAAGYGTRRFFKGSLDEMRIWYTNRSQAQIQAGMNAELAAQANLVAVYHCNQGVAGANNAGITTLTDASGNNRNGTLVGFALNGAASNWVSGAQVVPLVTNNAPGTYPLGATTVTWTATDAAGNTATCTQTVTVTDAQAPTITCPANITVNAAAGVCTQVVTFAATATDNCGAATITYSPASGSTFSFGATTVTATASDASGNTSTCTFRVTVNENQPPVITCPANITANTAVGQCTANVTFAATATDICGTPTITYSPTSGSTFNLGSTTVTATANDGNGNTASCSFTVTITDAQAPVVTCPANITVNAAAGLCTAVVTFAATATDNCVGVATQLLANGNFETGSLAPWALTGPGTGGCDQHFAVYSGNYDGCGFAPMYGLNFTPPQGTRGVSAGFDGFGPLIRTVRQTFVVPAQLGAVTLSWVDQYYADLLNFGANQPRIFTVELMNAAGTATLATLYTQTLAVGGVRTQAWTTHSLNVQPALQPYVGQAVSLAFRLNIPQVSSGPGWFAADNVSLSMLPLTLAYSPASGSTFPVGATTVTATATDPTGNTGTCTFTVTVNDNQVPTITCPANITVNAAAGICTQVVTFAATATDNCGAPTISYSPASGSAFNFGATTVTATASDANGNTSTCTFRVTVNDNQVPTITCPGNISVNAAAGQCTANVTFAATGADNCGTATITYSPASGSAFQIGNTVVTATANDGHGNTATCSFTVTVVDNQAPVITCAANVTQNAAAGLCNANVTVASPTLTDNCFVPGNALNFDGVNDFVDVAINVSEFAYTAEFWFRSTTPTCGIMMHDGSINGHSIANDRHIYLTNGNIGARLWDNETIVTSGTNYADGNWHHVAYTFGTGVGPQRIYVDGILKVVGTLAFSSWNGNSIDLGYSPDVVPSSFTGDLDEVRIWTVARTQAQIVANMNQTIPGNTAGLLAYYRCDQGVAGGNNTGITALINNTGVAAFNGNFLTFALNGATSNFVSGAPAIGGPVLTNSFNGTANASGTYPVGTTTVTWTATDAAGNTSTCTQTVTVIDNQVPTITCPANITVNAAAGVCTQVVTFAATATDNCGAPTITYSPASGSTFNFGATTVTATANDGRGNTATCSFTVTVNDNQAPTLTCPANIVVNAAAGVCTQVVTFAATATDNCGTATITYSQASGSTFNTGATTVTVTANDGNGNISTCTFTVTVVDNQAPSFVPAVQFAAPAQVLNNVPEASQYNLVYTLDFPNTANWDAQNQIPYSVNNAAALAGVPFDRIGYMMLLNGQWVWVSMNAFTNNVALTGIPTGSTAFQQIVTNMNVLSGGGAPVTNGTGISTGNIEIWSHCYLQPLGLGGIGGNPSLFDFNDNYATENCWGSFQVHNWGAQQTLFAASGWSNSMMDLGIGNRGVGDPDWTFSNNGPTYTTKRLYVMVRPASACVANINVNAAAGQCTAVVTYTHSATDNCGTPTITFNPPSGTAFNYGTTTVTTTATDASGNTSTCTFTVTVNDNQAPSITCPGTVTANTAAGQCSANVTFAATATDNCGTATITYSPASGSTFQIGNTVVTATANDGNGNTATCSFTVTVVDNLAPSITCAANVTVNAAAGTCNASVTVPMPTITDNCGDLGNALDFDGNGDIVTAGAVGTVNTIEFWMNPVDPVNGIPSTNILMGFNNATDSYVTLNNVAAGAINETVSLLTVGAPLLYIRDVLNPGWNHIAFVSNGTVYNTVYVNGNPVTVYTRDGSFPPTINITSLKLGARAGAGTPAYYAGKLDELRFWSTSRTQAQIRASMMSELAAQAGLVGLYHFNEGVPYGDNTLLTTTADAAAVPHNGTLAGFTKNGCVSNWVPGVTGVTLTNSFNGTCNATGTYPVGTTTVTYTATDAAGNTATCTQTVTVVDNQVPVVTCPGNITVNAAAGLCTATATYAATATDNCGIQSITYNPASGSTFNIGANTVAVTATDVNGNTATCSFTVTVTDNQAPVITCPGNITVNAAAGQCSANVTFAATATDNCGTATIAYSAASGSSFNVGNTTVTATANDGNGNTATCSFVVTVVDNQAPVITCAPNVTINATAGLCTGTTTLTAPTVTENCNLFENAIHFDGTNDRVNSVNNINFGTTLTWECWMKTSAINPDYGGLIVATDQAGLNAGSFGSRAQLNFYNGGRLRGTDGFGVSGNINVSDGQWHHVAIVANGPTTWLYIDGNLDATGTSGLVNINRRILLGAERAFSLFSNVTMDEVRIWTVARTQAQIQAAMNAPLTLPQAGLALYYQFNQGVANGNNAGLTTTLDATANANNGAVVNLALNGATSNFVNGPTGIGVTNNAPGTYPVGTTTVTWTATDAAGNTSTCTQTVTVVDNQNPVVTCPGNITVNAAAGLCTAVVTYAATATDNCGIQSTVYNPVSGSTFNFGVNTVTVTTTDVNNNTATCSFTVTVNDNQAPAITCPGNITVNTAAGQCSANVTFAATATDNCGTATITYSPASGSSFNVGNTTVTATANDGNGNTATCTFVVTVVDNQAPVIACAANVTVNATAGLCTGTATLTAPTVSDNCNPWGNALYFDGSNDQVQIPVGGGFPTGNASRTIEMWVYRAVNTDYMIAGLHHNGGAATSAFGMRTVGGQLAFWGHFADFTLNNVNAMTLPVAAWAHIAYTYDGTTIRAYINGTLVGTQAVSLNSSTTDAFQIGNVQDWNFFNGMIDEVRIWNVARSGAQIVSTMNGQLTGTEPGLTNYLRFNQGVAGGNNAGLTTANATVGPNATLLNFALNGAVSNWVGGNTGLTLTNNAPGTYPVGNTTVTWTVADAAGNTATCTQTVTVVDNQNPVVTCPANITVNAAAGLCTAVVTYAATATDNCGIQSTVYNPVSGSTFNYGVNTVTVTTTDVNNNTATCSFTVTVNDNQVPTITCPANIVVNAATGVCTAVVSYTATATDNCGTATISYSPASGSVFNFGTTTVTATANDGHGNTATCSFTVTVNDNQAPSITCPSNIVVNAAAGVCTAVVSYTATATDNCGTATISYSPASGSVFNFGTTTVTATANDGNGNTATCSFTVTVNDNQAPSITCPSNIVVNAAAGVCTAVVNFAATATDNCGTATLSYSPASGSTFNTGTTTVTATANDGNGNTSTCSFTVTVTPNAFTLSTSVVDATCGNANGSVDLTVTGGVGTLIYVWSNGASTQDLTNVPGGVYTVMVTDACGASATTSATVGNGVDNTPPTITCPSNIVVNAAAGVCTAVVSYTATATDNCGTASVTYSPVSGTAFNFGTTTVTATATDGNGNTSTCSFTVTVNDNQAPSITCPGNISVNAAAGQCSANVTFAATATDNCGTATITYSPASGSSFNVGNTTVTATANDGNGNTSTCTFTVTVVDNQAPVITCAANVTINATAGLCTGTTTLTAPTVVDNCSPLGNALAFDGVNDQVATGVTLGNNPVTTIECWIRPTATTDNMRILSNLSGPVTGFTTRFQAGKLQFWSVCGTWQDISNTVIPVNQWTHIAVVANGNQITGFVNGVQGLTITCATLFQNIGLGGNFFANGTYYQGAMDEVRIWNVARTPAQILANMNVELGAQAGLVAVYHLNQGVAGGNNAGITTAIDDSGNNFTGTLSNFALNGLVSNWVGGNGIVLTNNAPGTYPVGITTVTWTATDVAGNTSTCTQTVTVVDNQNPVVTCPGNITVNAAAGQCSANVTFAATATDNCGTATITYSPASGSVFNFGTTTVTATANDGNGNTATCSFAVTVNDNQVPTITCPGNISVNAAAGQCSANVTFAATATDNCGTATITYSPASGSVFNFGTTTVTATANDGNGNTATCSFTVTVNDNQVPTITCPSNIVVNAAAGVCTAVVNFAATATDNCGTATLSYSPASGSTFNTGTTTVTATANDGNGNTSTCSFTVTVTPNAFTLSTSVVDATCGNSNGSVDLTVTGGVGTLIYVWSNGASTQDLSNVPGGVYTVMVTDACGASATTSATVGNGVDNTPPTITCPSNIVVNAAAGVCTAVVSYTATATDNCGAATISYSPASGSVFNFGTTTVTATATDGNGNTATCSFTVTVNDNQVPSITCPGTVTANTAAGQCSANVTFAATATDICGTATITYSPASGSSFNVGNTTVTATANDGNGNTATCTFTVTVVDNQAPVITCAANITVNATAGQCGAVVTYALPSVSDNCAGGGGAIAGYTYLGTFAGHYYYGSNGTATWSAANVAANGLGAGYSLVSINSAAENAFVASFAGAYGSPYIGLNDIATEGAFVWSNGAPLTYTQWQPGEPNGGVSENAVQMYPSGNWNDISGASVMRYFVEFTPLVTPVLASGLASGATFPVGVTTNTYLATDLAGNTSTCSFTVTVVDNQNPVITCPANISVNAAAGLCTAVVTYAATATDNCGIQTTVYNPASGSTFNIGATAVTVTATDVNGRTATCSFTVTVNDNQAPSITCPSNIVVNAAAGVCTAVVSYTATATDNCGTATISYSPASGSVFNFGTTTVTATANDGNGNTATCSFTVTVNDNQAPSITCPSNIVVNAAAGVCTAVVNFAATATDNCGTATISYSPASGSVFNFGTTTVTATANDGNGNTATCSFTVTVNDNQAPSITCPSNIVVNAAAGACTAVVSYTATAADNCGTATISYSPASGSVFNFGTTTVTATANDGNGNTATCSFTVTVNDNQAPNITCPSNIVVNAAAGVCTAVVSYTATATDNCGTATVTYSPASGSVFNFGTTTVTATANDGNGNTATCSFTVTVNDNQVPTITCPSNIVVNAAAGVCTAVVNFAATATDNCGTATLSYSPASGSTFNTGTTTVTATANDGNGNISTCSFTVTVTPNAFTLSTSVVDATCGNANGSVDLTVTGGVGTLIYVWSNGASTQDLSNVPGGVYTVMVTDACGASATTSATVGNGVDNTPPTITCPSNIVVNAAAGVCNAVVSYTATATDNCGTATISYSPASGSVFNFGTTTVTATANDGNGNTATCSFTVTVNDNQAPSITCPSNIVVNAAAGVCTAVVSYTATATDNCGTATISYSPASGSVFNFGTTTVTATANDGNGNTATCSFTVTVNDNQAPSITCPSNIVVNAAAGACTAVVSYTATAADNCGTATISYSPASGSVFNFGTTTVTATANDGNGNTATCSFAVTVNDNQAPGITCPSNIVVNAAAGVCTAVVNFAATATDNCGTATISYSPASGSLFNFGTTTVTATANDGNGNTSTCSFTVTVNDNQAPSITCPGTVTANTAAGQCSANVTFAATATDICGTATITYSPASGSSFNIGNTTVTATANDGNGNTATCTFTVTVVDNQAPVITCAANITVNATAGQCGAVVTYALPSVSDNCAGGGGAIAGYTYLGTFAGHYYYGSNGTASWSAANVAANGLGAGYSLVSINSAAENAFVASFAGAYGSPYIGLNDIATEGAFVWSNGAPLTYTQWQPGEPNGGVSENAVQMYPSGNWNDISGASVMRYFVEFTPLVTPVLASGLASGATFPVGVTTNTYLATDLAGNTSTCSFTVTVVDNQNPVITCPGNISVNAAAGLCTAVVTYAATATDNCGIQTTVYNPASGSTFNIGATAVTVTATDVNGRTATCSFTVTVNDNQAPSITCPSNIVVNAAAGVCTAVVSYTATATDNCGTATISYSPASGSVFNFGTTTVTATANDGNGNTATCSFTVTVNDNQAPSITCPSNIVVNAAAGVCTAVVNFAATATDNCGTATISYSPASGSVFPIGNTTVTATADDGHGNTASCSFIVTVNDNQAPTAVCQNITVQLDANHVASVTAAQIDNGSTDNCGSVTLSIGAGQTSYTCSDNGQSFTVTLVVTDAVGNTSSCNAQVTVADDNFPCNESPNAVCQNVTVFANGNCQGIASAAQFDGGSTDPDLDPLTFAVSPAGPYALGLTNVVLTVSDPMGATATCSATVTVIDNTPPSIVCANVTENAAIGQCNAVVNFASTATDNCGTATLSYSPASGSIFNIGTTTVTATANDGNGNISTCSFTVTVNDNQAPVITCPGNQSQSGFVQVALADYTGMGVATDNCGAANITQTPAAGTIYTNTQNVTVTLTATDASGNTSICAFVVAVTVNNCGPGSRLYVDDNPTGVGNNGTSWDNAFVRLESALAIATPGTEIWVKEGTYKPTPTNNRAVFYNLPPAVQLYGGFPQIADCNFTLLDRDPDLYVTNLSGDIGTPGLNTDNSYCIMKAINVGGAGTIVDGFVFRDAYALTNVNTCALVVNADGASVPGAQSSPEFMNCVFTENYNDLKGGAIYLRAYYGGEASPTFTQCDFYNNSALGDGGVIFSTPKWTGSQINPNFESCNFHDNSTSSAGGAVYSWVYPLCSSVFTFTNCQFDNNVAGTNGGAIANILRNDATSTFSYSNCAFEGNTSTQGSAIYNYNVTGASQNQFMQCTFDNNTASGDGTVYSYSSKATVANQFERVAFNNNTTVNGGGVYEYNTSGGPGVNTNYLNCVFNANTASASGGGIYALSRLGTPMTINMSFSTMYGNTAAVRGGAIANINQTGINSLMVTNSVIRGNLDVVSKPFYTNGAGANANVNNCLTDNVVCANLNSGTGVFSCSALISSNPMFVDAPNGDLHLQAGSGAIDMALSGPMEDYDGLARPAGIRYDYGAFEYGAVLPRMASDDAAELDILHSQLNIYPNPTTDKFMTEFGKEVSGKLEVLDMQGRIVLTQTVAQAQQVELSIGGRSAGAYLVRLVTDDEILVKTIILRQP